MSAGSSDAFTTRQMNMPRPDNRPRAEKHEKIVPPWTKPGFEYKVTRVIGSKPIS